MKNVLVAIGLTASYGALGFTDSFDGAALGPHWGFYSEGSVWSHSVSGGWLNVHSVSGPFNPDEVTIYAPVEPLADFTATAIVSWDAGRRQSLEMALTTQYPFFAPRLASIRYQGAGRQSVSGFAQGGRSRAHNAPRQGTHTFTISRQDATLSVLFDGRLIASSQAAPTETLAYVLLSFGGDESGGFGGLHVDQVSISP